MTRLWNLSQRARQNGAGTATPPPPPPLPGPPPELLEPGLEEPKPYESRPVRPLAQLAARIGLWTAVGVGCLGGLIGMFRPAGGGQEQVVDDSSIDKEIVPAPVAGVAEQAVEAWLLATDEDQERLNRLYVDPPNLSGVNTETLSLLDVTTVAGERLEDGYWSVTVAANLIETLPESAEEGEDTDGDGVPDDGDEVAGGGSQVSTWYVEIGIVGQVGRGLRAISTPGVVPAPPGVEPPWQLIEASTYEPDEDDDLAGTIEGFLNALLAGDGDPARYLAPHVNIDAAEPAPFVSVEIEEMAAEETDEGHVRIWVQALATTPGEAHQAVAYEIVAAERVDRWEIREIWGAPTVERNPDARDGGNQAPPPSDGGSGTGSGEDVEGQSDDTSGTGDTTVDESIGDDGISEGSTSEGGSDAGTGTGTGEGTGTDGPTTSAEETDPLASDPGGE